MRETANAPDVPMAPSASDERNAISLLREIQSGRTSGAALGIDDRRRVVEHLLADGYGIAETAEILKVSERTVARDRVAIREANALAVGPGFVEETVGELRQHAERAVNRLRRLAREKDAPHQSRVEAERTAWQVERDLVVTLQRLGYLPTAPQHVVGRVTVGGDDSTYEDIDAEAQRVLAILETSGTGGGAVVEQLVEVREAARRGALAQRVRLLGHATSTDGARSDEQDAPGAV